MKEKFKSLFEGKKKIIWIVAAVLIVIAVAVVIILNVVKGKNGASGDDEGYVEVASPLAKHDLSGSINVSGTVESREVLAVTTELTNSKIKELNVALGDRVEEGDVLCTFDDETIKENIDALEKAVSQTEKDQAKALADAQRSLTIYNLDPSSDKVAAAQKELDDLSWKRQDTYNEMVIASNNAEQVKLEAGLGSPEWYEAQKAADQLYYQLVEMDEQLAQAQQKLEIARLTQEGEKSDRLYSVDSAANATTKYESTKELANLYNQLKQTTIVADQAGVVTKLNVQKGAIASGTLMQIEDDSKLRVKVNIREKDIIKLKSGMKVKLTTDAFPDQTFSGEVAQVINFASSSVDVGSSEMGGSSSSSGNSYSAYINVDDGTPLLLGMTVKVEIMLDAAEPTIAVGYDAIKYDEDGNSYVLRAIDQGDGNYKIERVDVTVGEAGDYYTAIESPDLAEGDIILSYPYTVEAGAVIPLEIVEGDDIMSAPEGAEGEDVEVAEEAAE